MLNKDLIKAGMFDEEAEFKVWDLSPQAIIARIKSKWDTLGRKPNIGDLVWFDITEKGNREAEKLLKSK
ncbi:MAG: hypothetical protein SAJ37_04295 [Oscillatoria sp. PMC 1068.18]|nr:hypothetical protein [Oscillatoria sp. PMC 1068.18]